jgi:hypothetical protein
MRDWRKMTPEERKEARAGRDFHTCKELMDARLRDTLALLADNAFAAARAWKIAWGCYLVNTPEEIAAYCVEQAEAAELGK